MLNTGHSEECEMAEPLENVLALFEKTKRCQKCFHHKPLSAFYRHHKDGTQGYCKTCTRQYMHDKYRAKNPVVKKNWPDCENRTKRCTKCGETKSWDDYYMRAKRGLPEPKCRECVLKYRLEQRLKNVEANRLRSWHRQLRNRMRDAIAYLEKEKE